MLPFLNLLLGDALISHVVQAEGSDASVHVSKLTPHLQENVSWKVPCTQPALPVPNGTVLYQLQC